MTRLFRARARASSAMAGRALALLAFAASAGVSDAAYYYGRYGVGWGGRGAVRTTTVVRTRRGVYGRRLLQDEAEPPLASAPAPALAPAPASGDAGDDATECDTILDVVTSRPEFSTLASALEDLPRLREAMDSPERTDTFFAPTNDAIDALLQWGGFVEKAKGIDEMLGNVSLKALIIAYHAVPNVTYTAADLAAKGADDSEDRFVDTALGRVLEAAEIVDAADPGTVAEPLIVDENLGDVFLKGIGSEAKVVTPDIPACGSIVHAVNTVLLPLDGDDRLDEFQKRRVAEIRARSRAIIEKRAAEAAEREDQDDEYDEYDDVAAAPTMAPEMAPAAAPETA